MARFCLVIFLAIYASGLVAQPLSEEGLGALSKEDNRAIDAPSYPGWKAIISYLPIKVKVISLVSTGSSYAELLQFQHNSAFCVAKLPRSNY